MNAETTIKELTEDLQPRPFSKAGMMWVAALSLLIINGLYSYYRQLNDGLEVTAMNNYVSWGIYISNFVFFVAVSLVGSLISAILKLSNAKWSVPLTRIAEIIAVACIMFAGLIIIVDMGRPERFYFLFIHGRIQSPIIWDVLVVTTYLVISILLLYLPLLPDLAILRDRMKNIPKWQHKLYRILSLKWTGSKGQYAIMNKSIKILAVLIIPIALGIHTVTSWLFASTVRPGWNSTNFGPYFVAGAFMVGAATVIAAMFVARRYYRLEKYFTDEIFDKMGKLLVLLSLIYLYFNINEYLTPAYKMMAAERGHLETLFAGEFAWIFWPVMIIGIVLPIILMLFKWGRKPLPIFIICIVVIIGAWFKRYLIVVPTLFHPILPPIEQGGILPTAIHYYPTWHEWSITIASVAAAMFVITILFRYLPFVGIAEMAEQKELEHESIHSTIQK